MLTHIITELQKREYTMEEAVTFILETLCDEVSSEEYHRILTAIANKLEKTKSFKKGQRE